MQKCLLFISTLIFFVACKKDSINKESKTKSTQLYPLSEGSKWIYIDSFFEPNGQLYGYDTFYLKPENEIIKNGNVYTVITDQWEDSIFRVRSTDTSAFMWEPLGESLLFRLPIPTGQYYVDSSSPGNALSSTIFTNEIADPRFPAYQVIITQDDGSAADYKQEELYFSPDVGVVKGRTKYKTTDGRIYISDSYVLLAYIN